MEIIKVENLQKTFKVKEKISFWNDLIKPKYNKIKAVNDISFSVNKGELLGFIGPNGAGKTTTIKMLSGILWPTSGVINVDGKVPYENRKEYVRNIGVVFGQRRSLWPELSVKDNFELVGAMYKLSSKTVSARVKTLSKLIDIVDFLNQPFRKLSLGQQMKAELLASLIHKPSILFLDEPTIGMDIIAKNDFIKLLKSINEKEKCTILLTSHDLQEIEKLCERIIIINKGNKIFDGPLDDIRPDEFIVSYESSGKFIEKKVKKKNIKNFLNKIDLNNVNIKETPLEELIKEHYK